MVAEALKRRDVGGYCHGKFIVPGGHTNHERGYLTPRITLLLLLYGRARARVWPSEECIVIIIIIMNKIRRQ